MNTTDAGAAVIEVSQLTCGYEKRIVLKELCFTIPQGQRCFIIGGSGCGKSTLLRTMIGLVEPLAGTVSYLGRRFTGTEPGARRHLLRTFGVLYQGNALWSAMTLGENIALPLQEHTSLSRTKCIQLAALKLQLVGLAGADDRYPAELSGGMRKRAALARALALDPAILFLDEPSAGLDPITSREIDSLILEISNALGTTMLIISHQLSSIYALAWVLTRGPQNSSPPVSGRFSTQAEPWDGQDYAALAHGISQAVAVSGAALLASLPTKPLSNNPHEIPQP